MAVYWPAINALEIAGGSPFSSPPVTMFLPPLLLVSYTAANVLAAGHTAESSCFSGPFIGNSSTSNDDGFSSTPSCSSAPSWSSSPPGSSSLSAPTSSSLSAVPINSDSASGPAPSTPSSSAARVAIQSGYHSAGSNLVLVPGGKALELRKVHSSAVPDDLKLMVVKTNFSLILLTLRCPNLARLKMAVNASEISEMDSSMCRRILHYSLVAWEVADSAILSPLRVARFLSGPFPELRSISIFNEDNDDDGFDEGHIRYWYEVEARRTPLYSKKVARV
ncbi:hypothetical protein B0H19DRAFT_1245458 [Mycena capillaripes]|nr:hypothetical protein B0H19DRAFT_1245458 [Mycena capillaripes]